MDTITDAIIAALPNLATKAVNDAYEGLKSVIEKKWGKKSEISEAVDKLKTDGDIAEAKNALAEQETTLQAANDPEVKDQLDMLLEALRALQVSSSQASPTVNMHGGTVSGMIVAKEINVENWNMFGKS